jgi:hypothetical protein
MLMLYGHPYILYNKKAKEKKWMQLKDILPIQR